MIKKKGSNDVVKKIEGHCDVEWGSPKCSKGCTAKKKNSYVEHLPNGTQNPHHTVISSPLQTACHLSPTIRFRYSSPTQSQGFCHSTPLKTHQKRMKCTRKKKILSESSTVRFNEQDTKCEKDWDEDSFFDEPTLQATQKFVENFLETDNQVKDNTVSDEDSFFDEYTLQATQTFVDNFQQSKDNKVLPTVNVKEIKQKSLTNLFVRSYPGASETEVTCKFITNETTFHPNLNGVSHVIDIDSLNNTIEEAELVASLEMIENSLTT